MTVEAALSILCRGDRGRVRRDRPGARRRPGRRRRDGRDRAPAGGGRHPVAHPVRRPRDDRDHGDLLPRRRAAGAVRQPLRRAEPMRIDWWTLALQAANFLVLVWLLQHFLYRPVLGDHRRPAAADRERARRGRRRQRTAAEAAARRAGAAARRDRARSATRCWSRRTPSAEGETACACSSAARAEAEKLLAEGRQRLAQERAEAAEALRQQATELAVTIAPPCCWPSVGGAACRLTLPRPCLRGCRRSASRSARRIGRPARRRRGGAAGDRRARSMPAAAASAFRRSCGCCWALTPRWHSPTIRP